MLRTKLNENAKGLTDIEKYIFYYVTNYDIDGLLNGANSDEYVNQTLDICYRKYFITYVENRNKLEHPFIKVWNKFTKGANLGKLIYVTAMYDGKYTERVDVVNMLYGKEYRSTIHMILKAFVERDWDELSEKIWGVNAIDDEINVRYVQDHIEDYANVVAENLDEDDLLAIISFCGWHNEDEDE